MSLEELSTKTVKSGRSGHVLPGYWPPATGSEREAESLYFFERRSTYMAQGNPVSDLDRRTL